MTNWKILNELEYNKIWDFVFEKLHFEPHRATTLINLPIPNKCFDISRYYNEGFQDVLYTKLHTSVLFWLKEITNGTRIYALNWQHTCYSLTTDLPFEEDEFGEWLISVFPNGDFIFFVTDSLENGIFGDGINHRISIWGSEIIKVAETNMPSILINSQIGFKD